MLVQKSHNTANVIAFFLLWAMSAVASADEGSINLYYSGGISTFTNLQVRIKPNYQAIRFDSWQGKRISMDCDRNGDSVWTCRNACSKGSVELEFSQGKGFDRLQIKPLDIVPRKCDGSASRLDRTVKTDKTLTFIKKNSKAKTGN
jgi:hypothetical protein